MTGVPAGVPPSPFSSPLRPRKRSDSPSVTAILLLRPGRLSNRQVSTRIGEFSRSCREGAGIVWKLWFVDVVSTT